MSGSANIDIESAFIEELVIKVPVRVRSLDKDPLAFPGRMLDVQVVHDFI